MFTTSNALITGQYLKKLYEKLESKICTKYNLTKLELDILLFLANNPCYDTAKDIVEIRLFTKSHVSKSIEHLIDYQYLNRIPDKNDRRCIHLAIEDKAKTIILEAQQMQNYFFSLIYKNFSYEEKQQIDKFIMRMSENIKEAFELYKEG